MTMLGVSPTLVRALIPNGEPAADLSSLRAITTTGEPWNLGPYLWLAEHVGGGRVPIVNISGGTEVGACFLSTCIVEPIKPVALGFPALGQAMDVFDADGRPGARRGRRARLQAALARDDARDLARPRAVPRHVLAPFSGRLVPRRLGLGRRGRVLVPARALGRHAQHRRQADRARRARVGGRVASGRGRGGGDRRAARGEGRGRLALLRADARAREPDPAEIAARSSRRSSGRRSRRSGSCSWPRCRRRARRRSCGARCGRRRSGRIRATSRRSRTRNRSTRSGRPSMAELSGVALVTGGGRGIGANIARELAGAGMEVVVTGRTREQVEAVADEIGGRALVGDVSRREDVERWFARRARSSCSSTTPASPAPATASPSPRSGGTCSR